MKQTRTMDSNEFMFDDCKFHIKCRCKSRKMYSFLEHTQYLYSLQFYILIHILDIIYFEYKIFSSSVLFVSISLAWLVGDHSQFYSQNRLWPLLFCCLGTL
jgi:hypothetical protein